MSKNMRRDFRGRADLIDYLSAEFPDAKEIDDHIPDTKGGRRAAETLLAETDPIAYENSRNYLDGAVTFLSPYIRHGVLSLAEVRDVAFQTQSKVGKLVQELAWRDYFQRIYGQIGAAIWQDREAYKTGFKAEDYSDELPDDIKEGQTGLACIDAFSRDLVQTGYLHNHARMWLAAYIVHWRRVKWQTGAHWFLQHLLDGDPASNNMSWQWVASTFSHKPYFYNRENVEKFSNGRYCQNCPLFGHCDFEGSYLELEKALFPNKSPTLQQKPKSANQRKRKRWHQ